MHRAQPQEVIKVLLQSAVKEEHLVASLTGVNRCAPTNLLRYSGRNFKCRSLTCQCLDNLRLSLARISNDSKFTSCLYLHCKAIDNDLVEWNLAAAAEPGTAPLSRHYSQILHFQGKLLARLELHIETKL